MGPTESYGVIEGGTDDRFLSSVDSRANDHGASKLTGHKKRWPVPLAQTGASIRSAGAEPRPCGSGFTAQHTIRISQTPLRWQDPQPNPIYAARRATTFELTLFETRESMRKELGKEVVQDNGK